MLPTGELRKGVAIILDGELMRIVEQNHVKQGRGSAFVRLTLRNVRTGAITTRTFQAGEKFAVAELETKKVQYLYHEGDDFYFMDNETYDQPVVSRAMHSPSSPASTWRKASEPRANTTRRSCRRRRVTTPSTSPARSRPPWST